MPLIWAILLCLLLAAGWLGTLLGMPGNWLIVAAVIAYVWLVPDNAWLAIGSNVALVLLGLAILGELAELAAGALGVAKAGGSKRSAALALIGSISGGVIGMVVGVPIPMIGPLVAAVLFAGLGALAGAMLGESWKGRDLDQSVRVGMAAFWGRLLGTLVKTLIASIMVAVALGALVL